MENIKDFNTFVNESLLDSSIVEDQKTSLYLEGEITYQEWEEHIDSLNEGKIKDFLKEKIKPILKSIANKLSMGGKKTLKVIQKVYDMIKGLSKKNPKVFKIIVIMLVILLVGTVSVAAKAMGGEEPSQGFVDYINSAYGILQNLLNTVNDVNFSDVMNAQAYLIDIRDGVIDDPTEITNSVQTLIDNATNKVGELADEKEYELLNYVKGMGEEITGYVRNTSVGKETIEFLTK